MGETHSFKRKKKREGNQRDFRILTRKRISECNSGFVHHWIWLQVLCAWCFKLSGYIGKKRSTKKDKCFALSIIYFGILYFYLYCTNQRFILLWVLIVCFSAFVEGSLISLLIIVKLFFWFGDSNFYFCTLYFIGVSHIFL